MRLLDAGLAELAEESLKYLTVQVERDNRNGRRFYERRMRDRAALLPLVGVRPHALQDAWVLQGNRHA
jgi:hypothetical protein